MRTNSVIVVAVLLLASRGAAAQDASATTQAKPDAVKTAEQSIPDVPLVNEVDFGFRGTVFGSDSDQARFQRYRDVRDGGTFDRFRLFKDTSEYKVAVQADHIGYRDQRFLGSYTNFGKVKASFEWNQIPLFYSQETRTLYDRSNPGTLTLNDSVQSGIQNRTLTLANALTAASAFDLRTRRDVSNANVVYSATPNVDLTFKLTNIKKQGAYPWGGSFGIGGAIATEMPVPVDHRTTDVGTSLEYANDRAYARLGYDGSFFRNDVPTLVWDNPSRVTDAAVGGPAQGRMSLWPNTDMNTVSAAGGVKLPGRSRASAFVSIANMSNNATLLPFTINSALVSPALDRPTADITARVTAMNYVFTSRPVNTVWFSARYRQYQFDNRTEPFFVGNGVNYDTSPVALNI